MRKSNPFLLNTSRLSIRMISLLAVSSKLWGLKSAKVYNHVILNTSNINAKFTNCYRNLHVPSAPVQYFRLSALKISSLRMSLLYQLLALNDSVLLEHFKIVFLICRMLIHNKQVIF